MSCEQESRKQGRQELQSEKNNTTARERSDRRAVIGKRYRLSMQGITSGKGNERDKVAVNIATGSVDALALLYFNP